MTTSSADICNRALGQIAAQAIVTGAVPNLTGGGNASTYCNILYSCVVETLLREQDWEFSKTQVALTPSGNTPLFPFLYEYLYPTDCIRIRQVVPPTASTLDPQPVYWTVGENGGVKVIDCNLASALLIYTTNTATESQWDAMFQETVIQDLGSELAMALAGRPDLMKTKLAMAGQIMSAGSGKDS